VLIELTINELGRVPVSAGIVTCEVTTCNIAFGPDARARYTSYRTTQSPEAN
jgi:hypothetical protein